MYIIIYLYTLYRKYNNNHPILTLHKIIVINYNNMVIDKDTRMPTYYFCNVQNNTI